MEEVFRNMKNVFRNVDVDIVSRKELSPLMEELGDEIFVLRSCKKDDELSLCCQCG